MPGIELVNPGLLRLHYICLERGRDRQTDRQIHVETLTDRQTDRQRNAIDTHNLRVFNIHGFVKITTL